MRDGVWNGNRIPPVGWVADATARHVQKLGPDGNKAQDILRPLLDAAMAFS